MDPSIVCTTTQNGIIFNSNGTATTGTIYYNPGLYNSSTSGYIINQEKDLDPKVLDHYLTKFFPWVICVTRVQLSGGITMSAQRVEIHVTVSPTHHTELMDVMISRIVEEKMMKRTRKLIKAIYEEVDDQEPHFIFSPEYSETILDLI